MAGEIKQKPIDFTKYVVKVMPEGVQPVTILRMDKKMDIVTDKKGNPTFDKENNPIYAMKEEPAAWAVIQQHKQSSSISKDSYFYHAILIWFQVLPSYRKMGLGMEMLRALQQRNVTVTTEWYASTEEGRACCLKAGFVRQGNILVWARKSKTNNKKEADNGGKEKV